MTELEALKNRHSVRAYQERKIEQEVANQLKAFLDACNQKGNVHLELAEDAGGTFGSIFNWGRGLASAPSAIVCMGPDDDTLDERVGYYGEQAVLYAEQLGLNTCWVGMFQTKGVPVTIPKGERLVLVIALGYGKDAGKPHKSKTPEQVSSCETEAPEWFRYGVELALLAPTAINQQKFEFRYLSDGSVSAKAFAGPFSKVDLGIVKYHFDLGRAEHGQKETFFA